MVLFLCRMQLDPVARRQSGDSQKVSPITPAPSWEMPGRWIEPSVVLTKGVQLFVQLRGLKGSRFGTTHGFTQLGCTGMTVPVAPPLVFRSDAEELKASAVEVALIVFPWLPQMREKKVGRPARVTWTVTIGFTPKAAGSDEQSVLEVPLVPAEYLTVTEAE